MNWLQKSKIKHNIELKIIDNPHKTIINSHINKLKDIILTSPYNADKLITNKLNTYSINKLTILFTDLFIDILNSKTTDYDYDNMEYYLCLYELIKYLTYNKPVKSDTLSIVYVKTKKVYTDITYADLFHELVLIKQYRDLASSIIYGIFI